jgi:hypothetical protein
MHTSRPEQLTTAAPTGRSLVDIAFSAGLDAAKVELLIWHEPYAKEDEPSSMLLSG